MTIQSEALTYRSSDEMGDLAQTFNLAISSLRHWRGIGYSDLKAPWLHLHRAQRGGRPGRSRPISYRAAPRPPEATQQVARAIEEVAWLGQTSETVQLTNQGMEELARA